MNVLLFARNIIISIITDRKVGFEFKDRNREFLNQPMTSYAPFSIKVRLPKPKWKNINTEKDALDIVQYLGHLL